MNVKEELNKLSNLFNNGYYDEVINKCKNIIKKYPSESFFYNFVGMAYKEKNNIIEAENYFNKAVELNLKNKAAINNLGIIYRDRKKFDKAEEYFLTALKIDPNYVNALSNYGNLKSDQNKIEEAIELFNKAISLDSKNLIIKYNLSLAYQNMGNFEKAKEISNEILKIDPNHTIADRLLSSSTNYKKDATHLKTMEKKLNNKLNNEQKINLHFAIGKAYEDIGDSEKSFLNIEKANNIKRSVIKYDLNDDIELFKSIKESFKNFNFKNKSSNSQKKIIFVLGMPRSGTTLVEQIISSHKEVYGAGELPYLGRIIEKFYKNLESKKFNFKNIQNIKENEITEMREIYLNYIYQYKYSEKFITDKSLLNFRWIGLIKILFPESKVIHCNRDSVDNGWSIYKNYFTGNNLKWSYNQKEIANYYNLYKDLMNFWQNLLPDFIYNANYEKITNDQVNETEKILKFCELDWDENCLHPEKNKTIINTASISQAREPVYKSSIKSSKKFLNYLSDLVNTLN